MALTKSDIGNGQWHVIAVRADGDRYIIMSTPQRRLAQRYAERFARCLEGVAAVIVEFDGGRDLGRLGLTGSFPVAVTD